MTVLLAITFLGVGVESEAYIETGNKLSEACSPSEDGYFLTGVCVGFVIGVLDGTQAMGRSDCVPAGATVGQLRKVVVKHLEESPADLHLPAAFLVMRAFANAYDCSYSK
jgi:hypothetical protein